MKKIVIAILMVACLSSNTIEINNSEDNYGILDEPVPIYSHITTVEEKPLAIRTNDSWGIVCGYNIISYATDKTHENKIAVLEKKLEYLDTEEKIDAYLSGSPLTGEMVINSSIEYGVPVSLLLAIMQNDSSFGTRGKGARTFNPGNVGNDDTGRTVNYGNWQSGVDAVAKWLNKHKVK